MRLMSQIEPVFDVCVLHYPLQKSNVIVSRWLCLRLAESTVPIPIAVKFYSFLASEFSFPPLLFSFNAYATNRPATLDTCGSSRQRIEELPQHSHSTDTRNVIFPRITLQRRLLRNVGECPKRQDLSYVNAHFNTSQVYLTKHSCTREAVSVLKIHIYA